MQKCYEEYTRKIIEAYLRAKGDLTETEVKIEEICFMNMVYEHHRIT